MARAELVVTIDGDGQNDPVFIPALIDAFETGRPRIGLVAGQRVGRKATWFKKLQSRITDFSVAGLKCSGTRSCPRPPPSPTA
jgi:hypothetical protein